jgi:hypothetical protein
VDAALNLRAPKGMDIYLSEPLSIKISGNIFSLIINENTVNEVLQIAKNVF